MNLDNYFAPLNLYNFLIFFIFFISMDSVGSRLAILLKFPNFLRYINWIFGLGLFIFLWFILHFFIPFSNDYVILSIVIFVLPSLPFYIKNRSFLSFYKEVAKLPFPLFLLLPILIKLFFLLSLPPYVTDELAYHFYSPVEMITRQSWDFSHNINLYYILPQTMETSFRLMFALTDTYATARLLHFMIFLTSISAISVFLKEKINTLVAFTYSLFALLLFAIPLVDSTRGYIDVAPAILSVLLLITMFDWLFFKQKGSMYAIVSLIGLIVGMKYTVLGFVMAVVLFAAMFVLFKNWHSVKNILNQKIIKKSLKYNLSVILISAILFTIMGGYWYAKNFVVTGNPIYPFAFKCKQNIQCGNKNEFFGDWGVPFRFENWPKFLQVAQETLK